MMMHIINSDKMVIAKTPFAIHWVIMIAINGRFK